MPDYSKLVQTANNLNQLRDELTKELVKFEKYIGDTNVGIAVSMAISTKFYLCYEKSIGGKWGLYVRDDDSHYWHIKDAPTKLRILAFEHLEEFLKLLIEETEKLTADMIRATIDAKEISAAMEKVYDEFYKDRATQTK